MFMRVNALVCTHTDRTLRDLELIAQDLYHFVIPKIDIVCVVIHKFCSVCCPVTLSFDDVCIFRNRLHTIEEGIVPFFSYVAIRFIVVN